MREQKNFWDRNAGRYDRFMRKDRAAYEEMYELIRPLVRHKIVLELATGTGVIAKQIVTSWKSRISAAFRLIQITPCTHRTPAFQAPADTALQSAPCGKR